MKLQFGSPIMISVSFYLLTPDAASQSLVYASISNKEKRLRFSTNESFVTSYCNIRKKKGSKDLVKKNTVFYFEYNSKLNQIRDALIRIDMDLSKDGQKPSLDQIRNTYYLQIGKHKTEPVLSFEDAFNKFIIASQSEWSANTKKKIDGTFNHLKEYSETFKEIKLEGLNEDFWFDLRDNYFVGKKKFSNPSSNRYLQIVKQFLRFAIKKNLITHKIDFEDLKTLSEIETFKIALKLNEVETLAGLDLSKEPRLDKVRDLFLLEILTGQRFSDIPALLNKNNISDTAITIYQKKTNEKVNIPLHPKLKNHLKKIFKKYPEGISVISNQKFNKYLTEICKGKAKFKRKHSWVTLVGKEQIQKTDFRYNLISSHTGRRTFCTLALAGGINAETIMKVTGHQDYEMFRAYVKVDDSDINEAFKGHMTKKK